jgi:hypothetical protein
MLELENIMPNEAIKCHKVYYNAFMTRHVYLSKFMKVWSKISSGKMCKNID